MAKRTFEQLLEHCLQEGIRTGDIEATLRRYPQVANRLRPLLEVALATNRLYADTPPPPNGLAVGRQRLLDVAARQRELAPATRTSIQNKERKPKMQLLLATRVISAILAVVIGTAAVGGGVTWAASDSLPGDVLYPVKLTGENLQLSLAPAPEQQVELALRFSDERMIEIETLVERGSLVPETVVTGLERHVFRAMNQAAWASEEEMPGLLERIAQRVQAQVQVLEQLRAMTQEQNQAQLENALRVCQRAREEALAGLGDPQAFRSRYQHRDSMPEDVTPPEPPTREPQNGGQGSQEPGGPGQNQVGPSQGEQQGDRDQDRDQDQDRDRDCNGDQACDQDQDRDRDQDQDQDRDQDCSGDQDCDQDQDRDRDQDRDQQQDQQPDQGQGQQPDQGQGQQPDQGQGQQPDQGQGQQPDQGQGQQPDDDQGQQPDNDQGQQPNDDQGQQPDDDQGQQPDDDQGQQPDDDQGQPDDDQGQQPHQGQGQQQDS